MAVHESGAFGLIGRDDGFLLVANHRDLGAGRVLCWDVPGGGVERGESLEEACVRELREETGLLVEPLDLAFVIERFGFRGRQSHEVSRYFFFHLRVLRELGPPTDPKIVDIGFKTRAEIAALCTQSYHREFHAWLASGCRSHYFLDRP